MSQRLILFALWVALLVLGAGAAAWWGWSPFADGDSQRERHGGAHGGPSHGGYYGGFWYGPMHK
ncbi:MAG: hypothetical protein KGJ57_09420 [Sphingomonadales bacterium]|nr:hypothetical protein [Sphingomonadales bacterium]MDE2169629.1 hypothetical protein [Sphingomonadales bacterium]